MALFGVCRDQNNNRPDTDDDQTDFDPFGGWVFFFNLGLKLTFGNWFFRGSGHDAFFRFGVDEITEPPNSTNAEYFKPRKKQ